MNSRSVIVGLALAALLIPVWALAETQPAEKNYQIVFHTTLSGHSEDIAMTVSEGRFETRMSDPDIGISGVLIVTEDFMHRLEYQFAHYLKAEEGNADGQDPYFKRSGTVILKPGETVTVVNAPDVKLGIEINKGR